MKGLKVVSKMIKVVDQLLLYVLCSEFPVALPVALICDGNCSFDVNTLFIRENKNTQTF